MSLSLLQTKLYVPGSHDRQGPFNHVSRPRLIQKLDAGLAKKLTVVCAPAGFGKSTLLSAWIHNFGSNADPFKNPRSKISNLNFCWLSLDDGDNDPIRFWTYVVASLQTADAEVGASTLSLLQSPQPPPPEILLISLLNDVATHPEQFVLVLDDYHVIHTSAIHKALFFLLDHLPPQLHILLSSRADPPWPLARLRSQQQLTELRTDDLRFTLDESLFFLKETMGLDLSLVAVTALETRTEGWIAGLQLAALSLQGVADREKFITHFSGSNRYIVDYLVEEVLGQQPEEVQSFLLQTSILERLCGPLCDAVTGYPSLVVGDVERSITNPKGAIINDNAQAILEKLEHANLFLIPLDAERNWYRYHHLFAEVLINRLRQTWREQIPALHLRASKWHEEAGQIEAAVDHALAIPDIERAVIVIEQAALVLLLEQSEVFLVRRLLERLPVAAIYARPQLTLAYGIMLTLAGQFDAVKQILVDASVAHDNLDLPVETVARFTALRSAVARFTGDMQQSLELARQALRQLPETDQLVRAATLMNIGVAQLQLGDSVAGQQALAEVVTFGVASGARYMALAALEELATYQARRGQLTQAKRTCEEALSHVAGWNIQRMPAAGMAQIGLGEVLCEWNDLDGAAQALVHGLERLSGTTEPNLQVRGYTALARVQRANRDVDAALFTLQEGDKWLVQMRIARASVRAWLAAQQARLVVLEGNPAAALEWAATVQLDKETPLGYVQRLTLVRLRLAQYQHDPQQWLLAEASQILAPLLAAAEANGWMSYSIEGSLLQALVCQAQGASAAAHSALLHALTLGEPEGYIRIFVDEGEPMRLLILNFRFWIARQPPDEQQGRLLAYSDKLLIALNPVPEDHRSRSSQGRLPLQNPKSQIQNLIEPLTERELEVLRLVHSGFSNREIADRLIVTVGTIKKHVNNIFGKLGAASRTQALARAREQHLL